MASADEQEGQNTQESQYNGDAEKGNENSNSNGNGKSNTDPVTGKVRLSHFTWPWFASTMSTGAIAVVLAQTPNRFHGLNVIGKIFFLLDLVLFLFLTTLMAIRSFNNPKKVARSLYRQEGLFFGAYWVSVGLLLSCTQSYGVPACGPWLVQAVRVLFWMYCITVLLVGVFQYYVLFQEARLDVSRAMPAWIFPIYPLLLVGPLASNIIMTQPDAPAYAIWVGALMLQGLAWTVALMMYSIYTTRLMVSELPSPPTRPGMFVSVGPAGYTAAGLLGLASPAPRVLPSNAFNIDSPFQDGQVVRIVLLLAGTFIVLFAFWFFLISLISVLAGVRRMTFTLNWWAFVFPNAGLTLAVIQLGKTYSSPGINGFASALTILLVIFWFVAAIANVRAVWTKQIMWPGMDEDAGDDDD